MQDKPISSWTAGSVMLWGVAFTVMIVGTVIHNHHTQMWGLVVVALAATMTIGAFVARNAQLFRDATLLAQDAERERLRPVPRQRQS